MFCCRASCVEVMDPGPKLDKVQMRRNIEMRMNGGFVRFDNAPRQSVQNHGYKNINSDKFLNLNSIYSNGKVKAVNQNNAKANAVTANGKLQTKSNGKVPIANANGRVPVGDINMARTRPTANKGIPYPSTSVPQNGKHSVHVRNGEVAMLPARAYSLNRQISAYRPRGQLQLQMPVIRQRYAINNIRPVSQNTSVHEPVYVRHELVNPFYSNLTSAGQRQYAPVRKLADSYEPLKVQIDRKRQERISSSGLQDIVENEKDDSFSEEQKHALNQLDDALDEHIPNYSEDETPVIVTSVCLDQSQSGRSSAISRNVNDSTSNSGEESDNSESEIIKDRLLAKSGKRHDRKAGSVSFNLPDDYVDRPYTPLQPAKPKTPPIKTEIRISGGHGTFWHSDDEIMEDFDSSKKKSSPFKGSFKNKFYGRYSSDDMNVQSGKTTPPANGVLLTIESFENLNKDQQTTPINNGSITRRNMSSSERSKSTSSTNSERSKSTSSINSERPKSASSINSDWRNSTASMNNEGTQFISSMNRE